MERNYTYTQRTPFREFTDLTNFKTTKNQQENIKLPLRSSLVYSNNYQTVLKRSKSKDKDLVKGLLRAEKKESFTDSSFTTQCQNLKFEKPITYRTNLSNSGNQFFNRESVLNKTNDFNAFLKPSTKQSNFTQSLKVSREFSSSEIKQIKKVADRQSRFAPSIQNSGTDKEKFDIRQSLGSLSKQIKNTLKAPVINVMLSGPSVYDNYKSQTIKNQLNQSIPIGYGGQSKNTQAYTRNENSSSFLLTTQRSRLKRPTKLQFKFQKLQEFKKINKQNTFDDKSPIRSTSRNRSQIQNTLGKSIVVPSTYINQPSMLKYSSVLEPLTPQLRTNKKYDTFNLQRQRKGYSTYQPSLKHDLTSSYSHLKTSNNFLSSKTSFLQYSTVIDSSNISKQRDSLSSKGRQSFQKELSLNDFNLGSIKGQGRFGKFYPAIHKKTGLLVGIKQIKKQSLKYMLDQFIQQLKVQSFIDHPNIVKLYGYFCTKQCFYLILEYMQEGSLFSYVKKNKKLKEEQASTKLKQICSAVEYLHQNDILHRDIKPQNIVMTCDVCKLCDFGWAVYSSTRRKTYCGTLDYVCPEILQGDSYDACVDIWAIGVLAYQMIVGKAPFYNISRKQTMKKIMECDFQIPKEYSQKARSFISKALNKNPDQRSSVAVLAKHEFLK